MLIVESDKEDFSIIDEFLDKLKKRPEYERLWLKHDSMLSFSGLEVDLAHRKVHCGSQEISLTVKEYAILCLLMINAGCVLTYDQIYRKVWGEEAFGGANNAIKCHIRNLREKLYAAEPESLFSIKCVREVGYCFELNSEDRKIT